MRCGLQLEAAELAAHQAERRAQEAESLCQVAEAKLSISEDSVKALSWQVKMSTENGGGAMTSAGLSADSWIGSFMGCGPLNQR